MGYPVPDELLFKKKFFVFPVPSLLAQPCSSSSCLESGVRARIRDTEFSASGRSMAPSPIPGL